MATQRRFWRWVKRIALGLVGFVVLAIVMIVIAVHTDWGREKLRGLIEARLNATFIGGAHIGKLEGSPFGDLVMRDVVINDATGQPAITVKSLDLELSILPLISHQARLNAVIADGVDVKIVKQPDGSMQLAHMLKPGPKSTWSVDLPDLRITRAHVAVEGGAEPMNFDELYISGRAHMPHGKPLRATVEVHGAWRERAAGLDLLTAVSADQGSTGVAYLIAQAGGIKIAGHDLSIATTPGEPPEIRGAIGIDAPAAAVSQLLPDVHLPADVAVTANVTPDPTGGGWTQLGLAGTVDGTPIRLAARANIAAKHAKGELATGALDLEKLSNGKLDATAAADVVFDVRPGGPKALPVATAKLTGWAQLADGPRTALAIDVASAGERAKALIEANAEHTKATIAANIRTLGDVLTLEAATVHAATADPARASGGKAPVHGALRVDLAAHGAIKPAMSLAVTGTAAGKNLRVKDLSVGTLDVAIDAKALPKRPYGEAHLRATDVVRQTMALTELRLDAKDQADGKVAVSVRTHPKQNPWLFDLDALVTPPGNSGVVAIDVVRHRIRTGSSADWTGTTGHLVIGPERIELTDLASTSRIGKLAVAATYVRAGGKKGDLAAKVDAKDLSLDNLSTAYRGSLDAHVDVARAAGHWQGTLDVKASGLAADPSTVTLDGEAHVNAKGHALEVQANASSLGLGAMSLAVDVDAPANLADAAGWKRLGRDAIRKAEVKLQGLDVAKLANVAGLQGEYAGRLDGDVLVSADTTGGQIELRDAMAPQLRGTGKVNLRLDLAQTAPAEITPTLTGKVDGVGSLTATARLEMPQRIFDPAAWKQLGPRAVRSASLRADEIQIDPGLLDRFHITSELRGRASVAVDVAPGLEGVQAAIDVRELRGKPIAQPLDINVSAAIDDKATNATVAVSTTPHPTETPGAPLKTGTPVPLLQLRGSIPLTLAELRADPKALKTAPLKAKLTIPQAPAAQVLAVVGRTEVTGGTLGGTVDIAGTVAKPTLKADLAAVDLQVPPGPGGKPVKHVKRIGLVASWDGAAGKLAIDGLEAEGGTLKIDAQGRLDAKQDATLTVVAKQFDMIPLLAFAPGPAGAGAGRLDANLRLRGLDPRTAELAGELKLTEARIPIAPAVGTFRRGTVHVVIADHQMNVNIAGKLGAGDLTLTGAVALDGAAPSGGSAKISLRKISPIGVIEPRVTADIDAKLARDGERWRADLTVAKANIVVPDDRGEKLKPPGAPPDMVFSNGQRITRRPMEKAPPAQPVFVINLALQSAYVESKEFRGVLNGKLAITADTQKVGIVGVVTADRGDLDLFGRRYNLERAAIRFDGSVDPLLDIQISHEFPDVTTVTQVRGRASKPELIMTSDPGSYSQGELLGFLLGGEPGGDPQSASARDKVAAAGESFLANKIGGYVKDALPIDIDVLRYEAATSTSSAAVTVGTWLTHSLFLAYRQHIEARPDENTGEGELEYWLSKRVSVQGTVGDRGYDGVDLLWRKRY